MKMILLLVRCICYRFVINLGTADKKDASEVVVEDIIQCMETNEHGDSGKYYGMWE